MLLLQSLSPSPLPPLSLSSGQPISQFLSHCVGNHPTWSRRRRSSASSVSTVHAVDKDSQQFEVDPDKAREALQKLDQQLQSLSQKQVTPPRKTGTFTLCIYTCLRTYWWTWKNFELLMKFFLRVAASVIWFSCRWLHVDLWVGFIFSVWRNALFVLLGLDRYVDLRLVERPWIGDCLLWFWFANFPAIFFEGLI